MINKNELKNRSIELRKEGLTYSEILKQIPVAKSTISLWLRDVGLAKVQKQKITAKRIEGRLRAVEAVRRNKISRVAEIKNQAMNEVSRFINDPFWLTGVILYWGEGKKEHEKASPVRFTNMDLQMHKIFIRWVRKYLKVTNDSLVFELFIHQSSDVGGATSFWSKSLGFDSNKLRLYLKRHNPKTTRKRVGEDYHGVLSIVVRKSIPLNRKIAGWVDGVVVYLGKKG